MGVFFGMGEFTYLAQAVPGYLPVAIVSCAIYIGQFAIAGWALGAIERRY